MAPKEDTVNVAEAPVSASADLWQSECGTVRERLSALRTRGLWTDCELEAGAMKERVPAHRVLLASASPVLASMLHGPLAQDRNLPLSLPDIEPDIARLLVEYIYSDNISINSCDVATGLYKAAHYLMMPHLETVCRTYLVCNVSSDCALRAYKFAQVFDDDDIREKCLTVMTQNASAILAAVGTGSEEPGVDVLTEMFAIPDLKVDSELELIQAAERWALHHKQSLPPADAEDDNVRTALRPALQQIRFLALDPDEFAEHDFSLLLSKCEILAISLNMLSSKSHMPMPDGFSTTKDSRKANQDPLVFQIPISTALFEHFITDHKYIKNLPCRLTGTSTLERTEVYLECIDNLVLPSYTKISRVTILTQKLGYTDLIIKENIIFKKNCRGIFSHKFKNIPWSSVKNRYVNADGMLKMKIEFL